MDSGCGPAGGHGACLTVCLIALAWRYGDHHLVVAANRDEFYARPTGATAFWEDSPGLLAGRDLQAGGTWMGITRGGRFAALTNVRDPSRQIPDAPSRGALVADFLRGNMSARDYMAHIGAVAADYNGFNLLVGDGAELLCLSNHPRESRMLEAGIYGLSNHALDSPWPKVERAKRGLVDALAGPEPAQDLFAMLADRNKPDDACLPDTGVGLELERLLSPIFVQMPAYGTRLSTVLTVSRQGRVVWRERSFGMGGPLGSETFGFDIQPPA